MNRFTLSICIVFSLYISSCIGGEKVIPATLKAGGTSWNNRIGFPDWDGDLLIEIPCAAYTKRSGKFEYSVCFAENEEYKKFERSILVAARNGSVNKAVFDNRGRAVWFQFRVIFHKMGNVENINVYPNHGWDKDKYGNNYTEPQR